MNYTDTQLKQALAKMLPETCYMNKGGGTLYYQPDKLTICYSIHPPPVIDTELLHLCWLAEKTLSLHERFECYEILEGLIWASWQQRVEALAKVKGIEI